MKVVRGGKEVPVAIALQTAPDTPRDELVITATSPFMGAKVSNLSPALAEELRLDAGCRASSFSMWRLVRPRSGSASSAAI